MAEVFGNLPQRIEVEKLKNEGEHINTINSYLGRPMQVHVNDGRVLEGRFRCFDKEKNVILSDATEIRTVLPLDNPTLDVGAEPTDEDKKKDWHEKKRVAQEKFEDKKKGVERKKVGLVLIPGKSIVKCLLDEAGEPQPWVRRKRKHAPEPETLEGEEKTEATENKEDNTATETEIKP